MHFPAAPDYWEIVRPEPVERSIIRAAEAMRRLVVGATTARDTGSREDVALAIRSAIRDASSRGPVSSSSGRRSPPPAATIGSSGRSGLTDAVLARVRDDKRAALYVIKPMAWRWLHADVEPALSSTVETMRTAVAELAPLGSWSWPTR